MIRVGVIGTGEWGRNHVRVYRELEDADLLAISDLNHRNLEYLNRMYRVKTTVDYNDLLNDSRIEALSICTQASTHHDLGLRALRAGKDVIIEKPLALNSKDAKDLVQCAEEERRILMVGHIFRFNPAIIQMKEEIRKGSLGQTYFISSSRIGPRAPRPDCGVIFDFAVHDVDTFCFLLNEPYPEEIEATTGCFINGTYEYIGLITLRFPPNILAHAHVSWLSSKKIRELLVVGNKKSAYLNYLTQEIEIFNVGTIPEYDSFGTFKLITAEGESYKPYVTKQEPLKNELKHFLECVKNRKEPLSNGAVGLRTVELIEEIYKSAATRRTTK